MIQISRKRKFADFMDETSPPIQVTKKRVKPNYPMQEAVVQKLKRLTSEEREIATVKSDIIASQTERVKRDQYYQKTKLPLVGDKRRLKSATIPKPFKLSYQREPLEEKQNRRRSRSFGL